MKLSDFESDNCEYLGEKEMEEAASFGGGFPTCKIYKEKKTNFIYYVHIKTLSYKKEGDSVTVWPKLDDA